MRFISVDLPEPDGPMMATYSPRSISMSTPAQGVDLLAAHHVGLPEVAGFDNAHRVRDQGSGSQVRIRRVAARRFQMTPDA